MLPIDGFRGFAPRQNRVSYCRHPGDVCSRKIIQNLQSFLKQVKQARAIRC